MIDTTHLMPPDLGPRSNPVLYGIAAALAKLCPPISPEPSSEGAEAAESQAAEPEQAASESGGKQPA